MNPFANRIDNLAIIVMILGQRATVLGDEKALKMKFCIEGQDPEISSLENELRQLEKVT